MLRWLYLLADCCRQRVRAQQWNPERARGALGEDLAHRYLQRQGYAVVARNFRSRSGNEIDLVARQGDTLIFVEVKSRESDEHGTPDRAIDFDKQQRLRRAAAAYLRSTGNPQSPIRFDIVTIVFRRPVSIRHIRDVFPTVSGV